MTPGEYLSFEFSLPKNTVSKKSPCWVPQSGYTQLSLGFAGESKGQKEQKNPTDQQSDMPDNHPLDDLISWNVLSQQDVNVIPAPQMGEYDVHVECASNAENQLAFAIKEGWSNTFA